MHAFRLFRSCPATSSATPGRASKFAPTTPIGIRRAATVSPLSSVQLLDLALERWQLGERAQLLDQAGDATLVERETIERAGVERAARRGHVGRIRGEDRIGASSEQLGRPRNAASTTSSVRWAAAAAAAVASSSTTARRQRAG